MKTKFNKRFFWMMAAILTLCGSVMLSSCSKDDDNGNGSGNELNVKEKIIGKWVVTDIDGQPALTNMKSVYTYTSTTKAYMSASFIHNPEMGKPWADKQEGKVALEGDKMTTTFTPNEHNTSVQEFVITDMKDKEFSANQKVTVTADGKVVHSAEHAFRFVKVTTDYSAAVIGTWEGRCTSENSVFDDGQEHRWEYRADGTYVYYVKDGDNWVPYAGNTLNEYFVDGNLLCTRWVDNGVENREWWEINIDGDKMTWTALRQDEKGTTFTATFEMKKVELNVKEKILGKWVVADIDGKPALTNDKKVTTFVSTTKAYDSSSKPDFSESDSKWNVYREDVVQIVGNTVTLTGYPNGHIKLINSYNVSSITDTELIGRWKHITTNDGVETVNIQHDIRLVKAADDYRAEVIGLWECTGLSGIETYNDANARLEFATDGTYKYWQKNDFNVWNAVTTREFQNYFVDGTLLATRWKDQGDAELREWWEIESITNDEMTWKALRQNEEGENVVQRMTWKKVDN